jgi:hypothetical protein
VAVPEVLVFSTVVSRPAQGLVQPHVQWRVPSFAGVKSFRVVK